MLIDPDAFEACFSAWAQSFAEAFDREVVAIDGKTVRRSFDRGRAQGPLHLVSAWASEQGLVLGQREVDGKSNEITAIPALLETLELVPKNWTDGLALDLISNPRERIRRR